MNFFWPSKAQWEKWSLPSKWGLIGGIVGVIGLVLAVAIPLIQKWWDTGPEVVRQLKGQERTLSEIKALLSTISNTAYREVVAEVLHAFDPRANIIVGGVLDGPDGVRRVDLVIQSVVDGISKSVVVDVVDLPPGRKAGIDIIDGFDSKKGDIKADLAIICSNTGFDSVAISKAKRRQISLVSVLHQGDSRVTAVIEEEIYLRKIFLGPMEISYSGRHSFPPQKEEVRTHDLHYDGKSVDAWLQQQAAIFATIRPESAQRVTLPFKLKKPTSFEIRGKRVELDSFTISFNPRTQWLAQTVVLDAKNGIYDYLRGRVRLAPGANSYVIKGINFDTATPLSTQPVFKHQGIGSVPGEVDVFFTMVEGLNLPPGTEIPKLEDIVRPEDLRPALPP